MSRARWLAIAVVVAVAVATGIQRLNDSPDASEGASSDELDAQGPDIADAPHRQDTVARVAPPDFMDNVVSRVDADPPTAIDSVDAGREGAASHIGPAMDPDMDDLRPTNRDVPRHIGDYLDPDDEYIVVGSGPASHLGDYLDPLADE